MRIGTIIRNKENGKKAKYIGLRNDTYGNKAYFFKEIDPGALTDLGYLHCHRRSEWVGFSEKPCRPPFMTEIVE